MAITLARCFCNFSFHSVGTLQLELDEVNGWLGVT